MSNITVHHHLPRSSSKPASSPSHCHPEDAPHNNIKLCLWYHLHNKAIGAWVDHSVPSLQHDWNMEGGRYLKTATHPICCDTILSAITRLDPCTNYASNGYSPGTESTYGLLKFFSCMFRKMVPPIMRSAKRRARYSWQLAPRAGTKIRSTAVLRIWSLLGLFLDSYYTLSQPHGYTSSIYWILIALGVL